MPVLNYIYIAAILVAFLSSLVVFRLDFSFHFKVFSILLGVTLLVEIFASIVGHVWHKNNAWVYNTFMLPEFCVYAYFYYQVVRMKILRRIIILFLLAFPVIWVKTLFFPFGFYTWNSYVIVAGSFFSVLFALMYYYQAITGLQTQALRDMPEFWIATGMFIFYLCALPYFGTLNFLMDYSKHAATILLRVLKVVNTFMYLLFSYAFLCRIIISKRSPLS